MNFNEEWIKLQKEEDLKTMSLPKYIEKIEKTNKIGFNHPSFEKFKKKQDDHDLFIQYPIEVEEGALECIKCKSKKVLSIAKQTRASDESITIFAECTVCNTKWTH